MIPSGALHPTARTVLPSRVDRVERMLACFTKGFLWQRVRSIAIFLVVAIAGLSGCGGGQGRSQDELAAYLHDAEVWAPIEAETHRTIKRILQTQFVDEALVRQEVASALTRIDGHLVRIEPMHPRDPGLYAIHQAYTRAWIDLRDGLRLLPEGFDQNDYAKLAAGRKALEMWQAAIVAVADQLSSRRASD